MVGYRVRSCTLVGESNLLTFGLFRGFTDFAGSAVVHLAGAVLSLPGCVILGARFMIKNRGEREFPFPVIPKNGGL